MKKTVVLMMFLFLLLVGNSNYLLLSQQQKTTVSFDKDQVGKIPAGFTCDRSGRGKMGNWVIMKEAAELKNIVLAQTDMDRTGYRFPICIYDGFSAADVEIGVRFKPLKGSIDQAAGIVWRYQDAGNYYIVRANALENNVVLYKFEKGRRTDLPLLGKGRTYGAKCKVLVNKWSEIHIQMKGNHMKIYFNGNLLYEAVDNTHKSPGKTGLWTKADSYTLFDDFYFEALK
jgi:hypothetical protein